MAGLLRRSLPAAYSTVGSKPTDTSPLPPPPPLPPRRRFAVVRDDFDKNQDRMHLDCVFSLLSDSCCLMLEDIMGEKSPKRRLVGGLAWGAGMAAGAVEVWRTCSPGLLASAASGQPSRSRSPSPSSLLATSPGHLTSPHLTTPPALSLPHLRGRWTSTCATPAAASTAWRERTWSSPHTCAAKGGRARGLLLPWQLGGWDG